MKKIFKKNQVIITALAIMIAVAGYINYSDNNLGIDSAWNKDDTEDAAQTASDTGIVEEIESLDYDLTDETALLEENNKAAETNKETLLEIINNENLGDEQKQEAVNSMVNMTDLAEQEEAAELLLDAQGFADVVVNLTGDSADVIVPQEYMEDASRAQIEDIVKRKTNVPVENIVITPLEDGTGENQ